MSCMVRSHCECWYELLLLSPLMPTLHSLARIQYRNNFTTAVQLWCCCCMLGANQMTAATSALCRRGSPPWNLVNGQQLRMCYIVWISPQSHNLLSVKLHYLRHALQWPWPVRKRFSRDHCCRWRSKPRSRIVGSATRVELTTVANCQLSCHWLGTSIVCRSLHNGLRDFRQSGGWQRTSSCNGQSWWSAPRVSNLSVAALRRTAGGSMFAKTGNHSSGVDRTEPEIRRQLGVNKVNVSRTLPYWTAIFSHAVTQCQSGWPHIAVTYVAQIWCKNKTLQQIWIALKIQWLCNQWNYSLCKQSMYCILVISSFTNTEMHTTN